MISERARKAHERAQAMRQNGYLDPDTGYFVLSANYLLSQGRCCGKGCRHCPWPAEEQQRAGRAQITNPRSR